jgi:hypothetical protein
MVDDDVRTAASKALRNLRAAEEPDEEVFASRRVHLVAASLALVGTTAAVVGLGVAFLNPKGGGTLHVATASFLGGLVVLLGAKFACLFDRGALVGTRPIRTALTGNGVGWLGIGWIYLEPSRNPFGAMATMGFVFSMAVFAFYWQEAAGSWRLGHQRRLMHSAMIAFLVTTGVGTLLMLSLSARSDGEAVGRLYLTVVFMATMGSLILALILWYWGLVGSTLALFRNDAERRDSRDEL